VLAALDVGPAAQGRRQDRGQKSRKKKNAATGEGGDASGGRVRERRIPAASCHRTWRRRVIGASAVNRPVRLTLAVPAVRLLVGKANDFESIPVNRH
jgi:hypothetical protein